MEELFPKCLLSKHMVLSNVLRLKRALCFFKKKDSYINPKFRLELVSLNRLVSLPAFECYPCKVLPPHRASVIETNPMIISAS